MAGEAVGDIAGYEDGDKPEVWSGIGPGFVTGTVMEAVGGAWPEAVAVSVVAGGVDGAEAVGKLHHFY